MSVLQDWLTRLEQNSAIKLDLTNINKAAVSLGLDKPAPYVITVAGTNGKGSVVRLLEKLTTSLGLKTGCLISPHLLTFNERICINCQQVSDQEIVSSFKYLDDELKKSNIQVSYFEFITLAAWKIFIDNNLDIAILEIGLGGRLDAVNAIPKDLAIITSVDYDHQKFLGDTLEQIGYEKAGIIEQGIPVILGSSEMPESIFDIIKQRDSKVYQYNKDFNLDKFIDKNLNINNNLKHNNIATSLQALNIINDSYKACWDYEIINNIIANFNILGRCSWIDNNETILMDVAHNKQSIENLASYIVEHKKSSKNKIIAICGMLADKDIKACIKVINPHIDQWNFVSIKDKRGESAENLAKILHDIDNSSEFSCYNTIDSCYNLIENFVNNKQNNCRLVIFGSFYVVGPLYNLIASIKDHSELWKFS